MWDFPTCIFSVLVNIHFTYLWSHKEFWTAWMLTLSEFYHVGLNAERTNIKYALFSVVSNQRCAILFHRYGRLPWNRSSLCLPCRCISQSSGVALAPQAYHLLSCLLSLVNFRQLWFKSYWNWCITIHLKMPMGTFIDQRGYTLYG